MDLADFMVVNTGQDIGKPYLRVNALMFAGSKEGVYHRGALCSLVTAREEVVFTSQSDWPDDVLH